MGVSSAFLTAAAAGAVTATVAAANLAVPPDEVKPAPSAADVDLAASITIPIFDIDTPGPISISRFLALTLEALPNSLKAILDSEAGTIYDLPGLYTNFSSSGQQVFSATRIPGQGIGFGFTSAGPENNVWRVLGDFATGDTHIEPSREFGLDLLTGGSEGIGAALGGTLSNTTVDRQLTLLDSGISTVAERTVGDFGGQLSFMPFDGFKAVGDATLIDVPDSATEFRLGSLEVGTGGDGSLGGAAGLCLGSAQGTTSCGGKTAFLEVGAPLSGGLTVGSTNIISGDFSTNKVVTQLKDGQFSVMGAVGGTVKIGSLEIGRPIPIDIQIPRASSLMSSTNSRQQQSVRDSFRAVPQKSSSANETGGRHRAPLRDAVENITNAVNSAVSGKHAAKDSD